MKNELRNLISGTGEVRNGALIKSAAGYLRGSSIAGHVAQSEKHYKREETKDLVKFIERDNLWVISVNFDNYISEGAEQRVYLEDGRHVLKLNDAIYYNSWLDYFHNLLLHNFFFPDTAYKLLGFTQKENTLYAVVEQPFVKATEPTDLQLVKLFLTSNGFQNTRNHDYFNPDLGIILEDLHDENVLTENGTLRFIDTVFYVRHNILFEE
ncbi:MAG: hypothetical protein R2813_14110 [Flavobacteriales bacterium]